MTMKAKAVTVIMAVHNGEEYLSQSIESILDQTFTDFDFFIVDDGSTDGTDQILATYRDQRIQVVRNKCRYGLPRALNLGLSSTKSKFVARQDVDDISLSGRLESQVNFLSRYPDVCVLGTKAQCIGSDGSVIGVVPDSEDIRHELRNRNPLVHGSVMFRRKPVMELGGYDEFFVYSQDYELWQRVARYHEIAILPTVQYLFRQHLGNTRLTNGEEAALYQLLARRIARDAITDKQLAEVKATGLSHFKKYMDHLEIAFHCKAIANMHMWNGRKREAAQAYMKVIRYSPLHAREYLNLILVCLGSRIWKYFHSI